MHPQSTSLRSPPRSQGNGFATPTIDLNPTIGEEARANDESDSDEVVELPVAAVAEPGDGTLAATPDSLRRLVVSLGGAVSRGADDAALRGKAHTLISKAKTPVLRRLLRERGRQCVGCA